MNLSLIPVPSKYHEVISVLVLLQSFAETVSAIPELSLLYHGGYRMSSSKILCSVLVLTIQKKDGNRLEKSHKDDQRTGKPAV